MRKYFYKKVFVYYSKVCNSFVSKTHVRIWRYRKVELPNRTLQSHCPPLFVFIFVVCKSVYYEVVNIPVDKFFEKKV